MLNLTDLRPELKFRTSRSSGSGGQHVNKVETRVELLFDITASKVLSNTQKNLIRRNLRNRINKEDILQLSVQDSRSQATNREKATRKFFQLISKALIPPKKRKKVKPLVANQKKRLQKKKNRSEIKAMRGKVQW
ncbi:MAG: alternative ribosome rescue aminoacyl-tRNA hydrolase ArfB [Saprospiraceae bacterium]